MSNIFKVINNSVKYWYIPMIIGILFIVVGVYTFTVPVETYLTLTVFFVMSFLVTGFMEIFFSISNKDSLDGWGWYLTGGIITLLAGIFLSIYPAIPVMILPFVVGFSLMFKATQGLGIAFDLKSYGILGWGNVAIASVLGIILSFILIAYPVFTGLSLVSLTAMSFIMIGIGGVMMSINLKKIKDVPEKIGKDLRNKVEQVQSEVKAKLAS